MDQFRNEMHSNFTRANAVGEILVSNILPDLSPCAVELTFLGYLYFLSSWNQIPKQESPSMQSKISIDLTINIDMHINFTYDCSDEFDKIRSDLKYLVC